MCLNHSETTPLLVRGQTVFHEIGPWCQKGWGPLVLRHTGSYLMCESNEIKLPIAWLGKFYLVLLCFLVRLNFPFFFFFWNSSFHRIKHFNSCSYVLIVFTNMLKIGTCLHQTRMNLSLTTIHFPFNNKSLLFPFPSLLA